MLTAIVALTLLAAPLPDPTVLWEFNMGSGISASPAYYPSVDKPQSVLVVSDTGQLVMLDGHGQVVWSHDLGARCQSVPAVGDLDGDGSCEIVTQTNPGDVVVLDGKGKELWRYRLDGKAQGFSAPALANLDGDGSLEVLVGDEAGWLTCLSNKGRRLWRTSVDVYRVPSVAVADVNGDGKLDIVYGTENNRMVCLDAKGQLQWVSAHEGQFGRTSPTLGDLHGDGRYEAVFQTSFNTVHPRLIALNAEDGSLSWESPLNLQGYWAIAIADLDGDGKNEVFVGERSNTIFCFNGDGSQRWATTTGGQAYMWPPAIADINGDGHCEVIAGVRAKNEHGQSWFVLDDLGHVMGAYPMPGGMNTAPLVGDLDADGKLDLVLTGTDNGLVRCVTFGGKVSGARLPWVSPRYNAARTGTIPLTRSAAAPIEKRAAPQALTAAFRDPLIWGENALSIEWPSALPDGAFLEIDYTEPGGRRTTHTLALNLAHLPASAPIELLGQGEHTVTVRVWPGTGAAPVAACSTTASLGGFDTLATYVKRSLEAADHTLMEQLSKAPAAAQLLAEREAHVQTAFDVLQRAAQSVPLDDAHAADELSAKIKAFKQDLSDVTVLARLAVDAQTQGADTPIAVWEDPNPWDETPPFREDVKLGAKPVISIWMLKGEYESCAVHILNLNPEPLTVQVRPNGDALSAVDAYEMINVPRKDGAWVSDALSGLSQARTIHLAPGEVGSLWLTVNAKNLAPGTHDLALELLPLGHGSQPTVVTLRAEVDPVDLADAPTFRVCNWYSPQEMARGHANAAKTMAQALAHGENVFPIGMPNRKADANGALVGTVDWSQFDTDLNLMGPAAYVLLSGEGVAIPSGVERFGSAHTTAERAWLDELDAHLHAKGWDKRWALYPIDEPGLFGGTRIELLRRLVKHFRQAKPDVRIFANPAGGVTTTNFSDLLSDISVWCPEQQLLRRQPELAAYFLKTGNPVWSYEAPGDVKSLRPLGYYRANPWMAFQLGLSGVGFWTERYATSNDLWLRQDTYEWGGNYGVPGDEVISRRWEAWRDGIEDARLFLMLRAATDKVRAASQQPELVAEADKLLKQDVPAVTQNAWATNDVTRFLRDYDMNYDEVNRVRRHAAELLQKLAG